MYEVSCVAGNKVDAAYAVKSLSNVVPAGMGHAVSTQRHGAHSHSYKHKPEAAAPPPAKPDALKSHVMRLLKRSKSHTPATRAADHQAALREFDARRTVFTRPVTDEQRRRRSSTERRRSADKRVMVTIVDGLPVVVTGQGVPAPSAQHQSPHHSHHSHHPPPVMHHRHSHKDYSTTSAPRAGANSLALSVKVIISLYLNPCAFREAPPRDAANDRTLGTLEDGIVDLLVTKSLLLFFYAYARQIYNIGNSFMTASAYTNIKENTSTILSLEVS
ncbi:hypothetical protein EVAR_17667_1 [Eumeta japonica]|uniref:Uncharacterized protein n=1 Tax=Eumeta variegata TaxID=151549 RepID=A0A4C1USD2_EUMVA|nr:hypothetical protein EVAR_17667_1 [Eumeta japonica]